MWKDIKHAPKIVGRPLWVELPDLSVFCWAYWDGCEFICSNTGEPITEHIMHYWEEK